MTKTTAQWPSSAAWSTTLAPSAASGSALAFVRL